MKLGQVVATRGVMEKSKEDIGFSKFVAKSLSRYMSQDWGDICDEDKAMNDSAVKNENDRIVARYEDIYIITEWDQSVTTILFTHEY